MRKVFFVLLIVVILGGSASTAECFSFTSTTAFTAASTSNRSLVIISDLHLGAGKKTDGSWYETEDYRWPKALMAFLEEMSTKGEDRVDLILAGDLLDLWQPPEDLRCPGDSADPNLGCTIGEMTKISSWVVKEHSEEFKALKLFSQKGDNRIYILPGNHDAALLIAPVWEPVGKALEVEKGRVSFVKTSVWKSADDSIIVEHGHQIGNDVNAYKKKPNIWPNIVRSKGVKEYIVRSWGEQFIQKQINENEKDNQLIDNLSPESLGLVYWKEKRGFWGTAADFAQFVAFNLSQTSISQKEQFLGDQSVAEPKWDTKEARKRGHRLFIAAISKNDDLRAILLADTKQADDIRSALDKLALDVQQLPDDNVNLLCDRAAVQGNRVCERRQAGYVIEKLRGSGDRVLASHLLQVQGEYKKMRYFVYGHTHDLAKKWQPKGVRYVWAMNSGAFHRVIGDEGYRNRVTQKGISLGEGLAKISLEELPPCYTFVKQIPPEVAPQVFRWVMQENDMNGKIVCVDPKDPACKGLESQDAACK